jgi:hypothetical protein
VAKNDLVLLDGIIDERIREKFPSNDIGEAFEFLALEQLLKDYDLSTEEIEAGWVDGDKDGGIDGFYTLVNGHLVQDEVPLFSWTPKKGTIPRGGVHEKRGTSGLQI